MKKLVCILMSVLHFGCGGSDDANVVSEPLGISEFYISNYSNYTIKVSCESSSWGTQCSDESISPGETLLVGEFGDLGSPPHPISTFDEFQVLYSVDDDNFQPARFIGENDWSAVDLSELETTYTYIVYDSDLFP